MGTNDQDTDPSTPAALGVAPTDPTPTPAAAKASTDPGIGPPSQPEIATLKMPARRTPPMGPMGIVVPASSAVKPHKDSIELLLEGMQGPQPERPKTTPQTDGQASAAYHAEHLVRPARTSPDEEPKVVVERPHQPPTTRIDRSTVQAIVEQAEAERRAMEATAVLPQQVAPRVIVAVVAGLVVVLGLFVVLKLATGDDKGSRSAAPPATGTAMALPATAVAPPPATAMPPSPATTTAVVPANPPVEPAGEPTVEAQPQPQFQSPAPVTPPTSPRSKAPARTAPASGAPNLGEFKTTYH